MPTGALAPQLWLQALDDSGVAVPGALVNFYASGTSTRLAAYADACLTTPLSNPQACDAAGRLTYYLQPTSYKIVVTTPGGVPIGPTVDPVTSTAASGSGLVGSQLGDVFVFGGDPTSPVSAAAYPSGATFDKLHAGTGVLVLDSANLAPGTYKLTGAAVVQGARTMTVGIFIPAFVFPIFFHRQLVAIAENERLHPFLLGVAAGVIGLIAAVTVDIVDTGIVDAATAVLAVGGFLVLNRWHGKLTMLYVVLGCGLIGATIQLSGLA